MEDPGPPQEEGVNPVVRIDPYVRRTRFQRATSFLNNGESPTDELTEIRPLQGTQGDERIQLLLEKIKQCNTLFDFSNPLTQLRSREVKRTNLTEIIEYISADDSPFEEAIYKELLHMVSVNVFREFHHVERQDFDIDEDEPLLEISWPHMQLVYEILLRFLDSSRFSTTIAKRDLNRRFVYHLLMLFNSEDPRERDYLKTVIHRIYGKFLTHRAYIRKEINNIFLSYTFDGVYFNGISELLEILASIINGFSVPLKNEHRTFLEKVLLPLYSCNNLSTYHTQLGHCVIQFVNKDPDLSELALSRILKYWPITSSTKEIVYINEVNEIIANLDMHKIGKVVVPLFRRVCLCINSSHFQVAETAIRFIRDEDNQTIMEHYANELHPVILPILYRVSTEHWNSTIKSLVRMIIRQLANISPNSVLSDIRIAAEEEDNNARERKEKHEDLFNRLKQLTISDALPDDVTRPDV